MNRRQILTTFASCLAASGLSAAVLRPGVRRRMVRRRVRRRFRRRVVTRMVFGRPFWVVPVAVAVGWELMHENRVVVVREIKTVVKDGNKSEVAVVSDSSGKTEEISIIREDTKDNARELGGSAIADSDQSTPGVDSEVEEEDKQDTK